jgi:hypothetical protein
MLFRVKECGLMRSITAGGWYLGASALAAWIVLAAPASAQETRAEEIAKKQAEKAAVAAPYQPTRFEAVMDRIEQAFASPPSGFFPAFGSIYPGGSFTLGAGYRHFYARKAVWDIVGLYSLRNYKQIEVGTRTPWNLDGRWTFGVRAGWLDAPQVGFYGLGPDSIDNRANFRLSEGYAGVGAGFRPTRWTRLEADVSYEDYKTEEGAGRAPSIETVFDPVTAPGLFSNPTYIRSSGTAAIDWRTSPGYSRKGGYYGVTLLDYADIDDTFSFRRLDGEIIQHLPLLRENWVISVRGRVQTVLGDDDVVPYFMMPYLGSGSTLRAYPTGRFRDRHSLLTSAELRWIPSRLALDMAIFYDAGKVAGRREDLDFSGMTDNWGIGMRFHGPTATVLRIEAAHGSQGWNLVFATRAAF